MIITAGGGGRLALIDFTECEIDLMANYGGSDKKRGILNNGKGSIHSEAVHAENVR